MKSETSRRTLLTAGAAAIGGAAVAAPVEMAAVAGDDPIFAALAEWRHLEALHAAAIKVTDAAQRNGGYKFELAQSIQDAACNAVCEHERGLMEMQPTSKAGALAQLRFVSDWLRLDSGEEVAAETIRAAVAVLEQEAKS